MAAKVKQQDITFGQTEAEFDSRQAVNVGAQQVNEQDAADLSRDVEVPKNGYPLVKPPSDRQHHDGDVESAEAFGLHPG
jgi:hypothetical protein